MSKKTRQEKKEEEKRLVAEFEEALAQERAKNSEGEEKEDNKETQVERKGGTSFYSSIEPETIHCRRCKTLMENGVCPTCGFKIYVPMSEEKRRKITMITTAVGFAVFIVIFVVMQFLKN